jgi:hypothetical protein
MSAPDFLDYEPSRLRLEDMLERLEVLKQSEPRRRLRTIASARARLQSGHGIGMVMLCALGQMHETLGQMHETLGQMHETLAPR